jgi:hypothetical protein
VGFFFGTIDLPGGEKYSCIRAGLNHREAAVSEFELFVLIIYTWTSVCKTEI